MSPRNTILSSIALAAALLSGCQQILGLNEVKKFSGDGGADAGEPTEEPSQEECDEYCGLLQTACNPNSPEAAYREESYCRGACSFMLRTASRNDEGNNFDCRLKHAVLAVDLGTDNGDECKAASVGGFDRCGTDCEGYCSLYSAVCAPFPDLQRGEKCVTECEKLAVDTRNAREAFGSNSDTLQCRMAHLGAAAASVGSMESQKAHCGHSALQPPDFNQCFSPNCESYCALTQKVCVGDMKQYDSVMDCVAACKDGMPLGDPMLTTVAEVDKKNTVTCRRYHLYNFIKNGGTHCEHAGPAGDGHCGPICPAYCNLAKAACTDRGYPGDAACLAACGEKYDESESGDSQTDDHYNVAKGAAGGDTMSCRIYNAVKAFRNPAACASALGGGECVD